MGGQEGVLSTWRTEGRGPGGQGPHRGHFPGTLCLWPPGPPAGPSWSGESGGRKGFGSDGSGVHPTPALPLASLVTLGKSLLTSLCFEWLPLKKDLGSHRGVREPQGKDGEYWMHSRDLGSVGGLMVHC